MDARASFPLTSRQLGSAMPPAKTAEGLVRAVCDAHSRGDIPSRGVRDLVNYEALLLEVGPPPATIGPVPRDDEKCVLAPHVRILVFGAGLPDMLVALQAELAAKPRPARGWLVLWRGGELLLPREEGWFLESFREPELPSEAIEDDEDRAMFTRLWKMGILARG